MTWWKLLVGLWCAMFLAFAVAVHQPINAAIQLVGLIIVVTDARYGWATW